MTGLAFGILAGFLLPIQTCLNSRLRESVGSPFLSSLFSFAGGTLFLILLVLGIDHSLLFSPDAVAGQPAWIWLGGLFGVIGLTTNILIFPKLGGVQTTVIPITGQILMGLVIDHFGLFESAQSSLTPLRALGALLVLAGALGTVLLGKSALKTPRPVSENTSSMPVIAQEARVSSNLWGYRALALLAGLLMASQSAINGHLGQIIGSSVKAALISFAVGTVALIGIALAMRLKVRVQIPTGKTSNPWWMRAGGVLGAFYVFGMAYLVPVLGTGLTVILALTGMMAGSLLVDKFGLLQAPKRPVTLLQVLSLAVMLAGIALIRLL